MRGMLERGKMDCDVDVIKIVGIDSLASKDQSASENGPDSGF